MISEPIKLKFTGGRGTSLYWHTRWYILYRDSYRIYSFGGGGELKMFGVYVMGVHKQAQSTGVWGLPPRFFFCKIDALRLILTQLHLATESSDTVASCHIIYTIIIRKANHRIIAHGQNILD